VRDMKVRRFAQMPANRKNPSVGNTPIRAPSVSEGLPWCNSKRWGRNPSLTLGAGISVRTDPLLCRAPTRLGEVALSTSLYEKGGHATYREIRIPVVPQRRFVYSGFTAGHKEDLCVSYLCV
jgi:hypothetical protein